MSTVERRPASTRRLIVSLLALVLVGACDDRPAAVGAPGGASSAAAVAERIAAAEKDLPKYRAHDVRFDLPAGWEPPGRGTERPGTPVIYPVPYPNGHVVRFDAGFPQPGEEGAVRLSQQFLADKRKEHGEASVAELSPARHAKHPRGHDMVVQHLTMPERGVGTMHVVAVHLTGKYRGQTMMLRASRPELLAKYRPDFETIVQSAILLSSIELTPEVAEFGSLDLYDVYRMQDYVEWLLDARVSAGHRHQLGAHLAEAWAKGDRETCQGIARTLEEFERLRATHDDPDATLARAVGRVQSLQRWRSEAKQGDARAKLMLEIYHASNPPLAGDAADFDRPALTRHTTDATLRLLVFMAAKVANPHGGIGADARPKQPALDEWAKQLAGAYPNLSRQEQDELAQAPLVVATLECAWPKMPADERAALIAQWRQLPFIRELAGANRADHEHLRELQSVVRGVDAEHRLATMGAYRLNYWKW